MRNFGTLKDIFNTILVEGISTNNNDKKKLFKKYIQAIKGDSILKEQFLIYTNIENGVGEDEYMIGEFVKTNISVLSKYSKDAIIESNKKLESLLSEDLTVDFDGGLVQLHEDISTLILLDVDSKNVDSIVESLCAIVEYVKNNETKESNKISEVLPNSMLGGIVVDKFNEKYSDLSESDKNVLKTIITSDSVAKEGIFDLTKSECITLIDKNLIESYIVNKEKLLSAKDKVLRLKYDSNSFNGNISKLLELKNNLK